LPLPLPQPSFNTSLDKVALLPFLGHSLLRQGCFNASARNEVYTSWLKNITEVWYIELIFIKSNPIPAEQVLRS